MYYRHIIRINKCRLWGPWEVEWAIDLDDVVSMPKIDGIELILHLKQVSSSTILVWNISKINNNILSKWEKDFNSSRNWKKFLYLDFLISFFLLAYCIVIYSLYIFDFCVAMPSSYLFAGFVLVLYYLSMSLFYSISKIHPFYL